LLTSYFFLQASSYLPLPAGGRGVRVATHQGALGALNLNWTYSPLLFANGDIQRSLGQRPRNASSPLAAGKTNVRESERE
ncbi:MAG: hypothetical protein ACKN82_03560, partial [Pirellula sp.]